MGKKNDTTTSLTTTKGESREELRRRLRAKIKGARGGGDEGPQLASRLGTDPKGALLSMGLDDPSLLQTATDLLKGKDLRALSSRLKGCLRDEEKGEGVTSRLQEGGKGRRDGGEREGNGPPREGREGRRDSGGGLEEEEEEEAPPPPLA